MRSRKGRSGRLTIAVLFTSALFTGPAGVAPVAEEAGISADQVAERALAFSGGIWDRLRYVRFSYVVEREGEVKLSRTHYWDAVEGRHRLEMTDREGVHSICLTHLESREGACTVDGQPKFDQDAKPFLDRAHAVWINDSYWLLMPYKMKDPGVRLEYEGHVRERGRTYDKVRLTFDQGVGPTSADRCWAYVDRETGRMDRWDYVLQAETGEPGKGDPTTWMWKEWVSLDGIMLSAVRESPDGKTRILFRDLALYDELPDVIFTRTSDVESP